MRPTRRALRLALIGFLPAVLPVVADFRLWPFWPLWIAWLGLALGLDAWLAPRRRGWTVELDLPDVLYVGRPDTGALNLRHSASRTVGVTVIVDVSDELQSQPVLQGTAGPDSGRLVVPLVPRRRGTACVERALVRYRGPFGLAEWTLRRPIDRTIPVVPDITPVHSAALRSTGDPLSRHGFKIERFLGDGTEFDSLKEFVAGDDNRTIDWKATARHRRLLSRQFRAERNHQVVLAVDTGHLMAEPLDGIPRLDHALNAALLLGYVCLRSGDRVGLYTFDARVGIYAPPRGGIAAHRRLVQLSSRVSYSDAETNFTLGLTRLAEKLRRRTLIVVLTEFVDTVTAELLLENLERLAQRHLVVFVALADPAPSRIADARPSDAVALGRAVVADSIQHDRDVVLHRLRRMGVLSVDARPAEVRAELINRYLEIKRRERI